MYQIKTYRGIFFDPLNPNPEDIDIVDISHALSMLCRANGHSPVFYSVAQHSINCRKEALARGYSHRVQLACLLHDASEAYLSDITRPVKAELPKYLEIEKPLQNAIGNKWIQPSLTDDELQLVFQIDDIMLCHEFLSLMNKHLFPVITALKTHPTFDFCDFDQVEKEYLLSFHQLIGANNIQQSQPNITDEIENLRTRLLESKKYYFDNLVPSALEAGLPVIYAIFNKHTEEALYVGRTKNLGVPDVRQCRNIGQHFCGFTAFYRKVHGLADLGKSLRLHRNLSDHFFLGGVSVFKLLGNALETLNLQSGSIISRGSQFLLNFLPLLRSGGCLRRSLRRSGSRHRLGRVCVNGIAWTP